MIHWNVNPTLFQYGDFELRWYGLLFAFSFVLGHRIMRRIFIHEGVLLSTQAKLSQYVFIGALIGARMGHCLTHGPLGFLRDPVQIIEIWDGGLSGHGGALGLLFALWIFCKRYELPYVSLLDWLSLPVALAGGLIRFGDLLSSEIVGKKTTLPLAFIFHRVDEFPRHPAQLYAALIYFIIFIILYRTYWKTTMAWRAGTMLGIFLTLVFSSRFMLEFTKREQEPLEAFLYLNLDQLLCIPLIIFGSLLFYRKRTMESSMTEIHHVKSEDL